MGMVGYARVSTREQDPAAQEWELRSAGADRVFFDHGESSRVGHHHAVEVAGRRITRRPSPVTERHAHRCPYTTRLDPTIVES